MSLCYHYIMLKFDDLTKKVAELHRQEEEELLKILSTKYGLPYVNLYGIVINMEALRMVPEETARYAEMAVFARAGTKVSVALHNPHNKEVARILAELKDRHFIITTYIASSASLEHAWERYKDIVSSTASEKGILGITSEEIAEMAKEIHMPADVAQRIEALRVKDITNTTSAILTILFGGALALSASDMHIEPEADATRIRYRLDGVLWDVCSIETHLYELIRTRLKLIAGLKINITNRAQDGRFTIDVEKKEYEIRASVIPTGYGESIVMRFLDPESIQVKIEQFGINEFLLPVIMEELRRPVGMIITTGPTGSGKTTALYTFLRMVHTPELKTITLEDPIEYHLEGIVQTQTTDKYSFASGLRSILRQDPDVIMVGEIRDSEVAETAMNAALTGHLVFSTLHTNSAAGAFPRLRDLGIDARTMSSALNLVMAQRLVRRLCQHCKKARSLTKDEKRRVAAILDTFSPPAPLGGAQIYDAVGCDKCGGSGFKGRIGVYEGIRMDDRVKNALFDDLRESHILEAAKPQHLPTLPQDGILKVLNGTTSIDELERVIDLYHQTGEGVVPSEEIAMMAEELKTIQDIITKVHNLEMETGKHDASTTLIALLGGALSLGASDLHIEPEEGDTRIRYRLDGVLWDIAAVTTNTYELLRIRLKLFAGLKLNIPTLPQDGRFTIDISTKEYEVRLSVIPGAYGESIVMRFLDPESIQVKIERLGINEFLLPVIYEELKRPNGMIITTGPTGSGKTTLLYTFLQKVHSKEVKIVTLEDPIEYHIPGIVQTQIGDEYSFASGLRSILRQDPDVILVGEIRDREVAETAMNAALTGHLVFSTLHTNSAAGAFPRLRDLGVDPRTMGSALNLVIAQRLVRRLCTVCRKERDLTPQEKERFAHLLATYPTPVDLTNGKLFEAVGCEKCGGSGYKGRIGVYEGLRMDTKVADAIIDNLRENIVLAAAAHQKIPTMAQDGIVKVLQGVTSLDELERTVDVYKADATPVGAQE